MSLENSAYKCDRRLNVRLCSVSLLLAKGIIPNALRDNRPAIYPAILGYHTFWSRIIAGKRQTKLHNKLRVLAVHK